MGTVIAIINHKGGVAKSTTAGALVAGLSFMGKKVLAVDLDAQCNLSLITGANTQELTIADVLSGAKAEDAVQHTEQGDIIAGSVALAGADNVLTGKGKQYTLKKTLEGLAYDYIVIDTPPALNILTINALTACHKVVIPTQADILGVQGIKALYDTIKAVKKQANPALEVAGILITRYSPRSIYTAELTDLLNQLAQNLGTKLFSSAIREAIAVKESQIRQQSIFSYAPKAKVTADYRGFIEELLADIEKGL